jgi:hypothetical protein
MTHRNHNENNDIPHSDITLDELGARKLKASDYVFKKMISLGVLVPVTDSKGRPIIRMGEIVYERTSDPELLQRWEQNWRQMLNPKTV